VRPPRLDDYDTLQSRESDDDDDDAG